MHSIPIQIRFNDVDQMGHINNAVIMEFFDLGKSHYFHDAGIPVTPEEGDFAVMIVHFEVDFQRQLRYHDNVAVTTYVSHWGNKSLEVTQQVLSNGEVAATCRTILSGYSRQTHTSAPIPEAVKIKVQQYDATH